ncbi:MAG: radical SAM protein [Actinophytocola sp.]|nr:radical SAM protein [Actinophytocola sp.]
MEVTGRCQLSCTHCYAASGPQGSDGVMTAEDWSNVIDQAAGLGTGMVQFIGGEPTLYRALPELVDRALSRGVQVEVYTNLVHVSPLMWTVFAQPGVRVATSYYTDDAAEHESITRGRGSHARTRANIAEAVRRSIPLRVGLIDLADDQRVNAAEADLRGLGVTEFGRDHLRQVGRGVRTEQPSLAQLCGHCGQDKIAIAPDGSVWPCVFSRWITVGNVRERSLAEIITGPTMRQTEEALAVSFGPEAACNPKCCPSTMCDPQCSPSCSPSCRPAGNCRPTGNCAPHY